MKKLILILFIAILALPSAFAQLSCSIVAPAACTGRVMLKLSSANDAHAFLPTDPTITPNVLCCTGVADLVESYVPIPNKFVIGLETPADSHVSIVEEYANEIYITSPTYNVTCGEKLLPVECANYQTCLYEVPSGGADDHVFSCGGSVSANKRQVCCSAILLEEPSCTDSDNGQTYGTQGTTTNNSGFDTDTCNGNTLTETYCVGVNRANETHDCLEGEACTDGACVTEQQQGNDFPCQFSDIFWADDTNIDLATAAINLPVYAVIIGSGCDSTTAVFTITNNGNPIENSEVISYQNPEGNMWFAAFEWTPTIPTDQGNNYAFSVTSTNGDNSEERQGPPLEVTGPCEQPSAEPCPDGPDGWQNDPNLDADCDGVSDCFDCWVNNSDAPLGECGVPLGKIGCWADAWNCDGAPFGECHPDPQTPGQAIETRIGACAKTTQAYCPPPVNERICVEEEDFPVFGLSNILIVSLLLIGFYSVKISKAKFKK